MFPEKGKQFLEVWQFRQFSYHWLRVSANKYKDFWEVTKDALDFASAQCELTLTEKDKHFPVAIWSACICGTT